MIAGEPKRTRESRSPDPTENVVPMQAYIYVLNVPPFRFLTSGLQPEPVITRSYELSGRLDETRAPTGGHCAAGVAVEDGADADDDDDDDVDVGPVAPLLSRESRSYSSSPSSLDDEEELRRLCFFSFFDFFSFLCFFSFFSFRRR